MPLPPGVTTASYQVTFEAINPLYILDRLGRALHLTARSRPPAR